MAVWANLDGDQYYSCPLQFIPDSLVEFAGKYRYYKNFGTSIEYEDQLPKFLDAVTIYESELARYESEGRKKSNDSTSQGLGVLRSSFANRGR